MSDGAKLWTLFLVVVCILASAVAESGWGMAGCLAVSFSLYARWME